MITTIGVFKSPEGAEGAIKELREFGVNDADLSYIYKNGQGDVMDMENGKTVGEGIAGGAATGAVIGGLAGLIVANGILPGLGTLFVAGPLATALGFTGAAATTVAGAATGAAAGGLIGAFTGMGVDENDVKIYEDSIISGDVVVVARGTPASTEDIFLNHGAIDVRHYHTA